MPRTIATALVPVANDLDININAFARHLLAEGKSDKTVRIYTWAARRLETFLGSRGMPMAVANITREHVEEFFVGQREQVSPATSNQTFRSLQAFWKYLIAEGEVTDTPLRNMARPTIPDNPPPIVTQDEMRQLLRACDGATFANRRDAAMLSLFYDSGIRRAEMAGLRLADLDLNTRTALVTGKFNRQRVVRYGRETSRAIDRYLRRRAEHPDANSPGLWLGERGPMRISGVEQVVQRRAAEAGLRHVSCHTFRHGFADAYLSSGGNEGDLMQLAGWRARSMVDRYARSVAADRARRNFDPHSPMDRLQRR